MTFQRAISVLTLVIAVAALAASLTGILSRSGPGPWVYESVREQEVTVFGRGVYRHMSADVAVQGIGQDVITAGVAVPALLLALRRARRGRLGARVALAGVLMYTLVTYLFYLVMAMYSVLFLVYVLLLGCSFFAFGLVMWGLIPEAARIRTAVGHRATGGWGAFLIANAGMIAFLWLGVVVPPLLDGTVFPEAVQHYTTLVVQGLDLAILLPLSAVAGWLLRRRQPAGFVLAPVYLVFLTLLMAALVAKLVAMSLTGVPVVPAIFIIPAITIAAAVGALRMVPQGAGEAEGLSRP